MWSRCWRLESALADTQDEDSIHSELFYSEKLEIKENQLNQPKSSREIKAQEINTTVDVNVSGIHISKKEDKKCLDINLNNFESETFVEIQCIECSYKAPDYLNLKRHKEEMHDNNLKVVTDVFECKEYDHVALDSPILRKHELEMHASKNVANKQVLQP